MRLLLVTSASFFTTYGGGQVYVKNLVHELLRQGISPIIASPAASEYLGDQQYKGCRIVHFRSNPSFKEIRTILKNINPTIVHAHGYKAIITRVCRQIGIPCVVTAHHGCILCPAGTLLNHRDRICRIPAGHEQCLPCVLKNIRCGIYAWPVLKKIPVLHRLRMGRFIGRLPFIFYLTPVLQSSLSIQKKADHWQTVYKNASLIIAPSSAMADSMARNGCPREKIKIEPHGIPLPDMEMRRSKKRSSTDGPVQFYYVGRICHSKGVHVMLAAFEKIKAPAGLHIIGGAGNCSEQRYMHRLKKKYRSDSRIVWHGKIDSQKTNEITARFDVMLHPAIYLEVFGLTIAEALALGKPVISTRCGGAEMQIKNGVNGWLVEPNDANKMRKAMNDILKEHISSENTNFQNFLRVTSIENHVSNLIDTYKSCQKLDEKNK